MTRKVGSREHVASQVVAACKRLGLQTESYVEHGTHVWGQERILDVVTTAGGIGLGIACHFQNSGGSAELRVVALLYDIPRWGIPGIVVFGGDGLSKSFREAICEERAAVALEDIDDALRLRFGGELGLVGR